MTNFHCTCGARSYRKRTKIIVITEIKYQYKSMRIHVPLRVPWLKFTPICAHWHGMSRPRKYTATKNFFSTLQKSVCPQHIDRTLSVLEFLYGGNEGTTSVSNSVFQTKYISQTHQPLQTTPSLRHSTISRQHCKKKCQHRSVNPPSKPSNACRKYLVRRRPCRTPITWRPSHPKTNQQTSLHDDRRASRHMLPPKGWLSHVQR